MARRGGSRSGRRRQQRRNTRSNLKRTRARALRFSSPSLDASYTQKSSYPKKSHIVFTVGENKNRLTKAKGVQLYTSLDGSFDARKQQACLRKAIRREVIHATNKSGRGGQKPAKWNSDSYRRC
jgi:hypothetical protein